jgi:cell division protein FtsI (penicillin-binding protein 3)
MLRKELILKQLRRIKPRRMKNVDNKFHSKPARLIEVLCYLGFLIVIVRAVFVHLYPSGEDHLEAIANKQYHKPIELGHYRGTIYDRRHVPLAISTKVPSIAVNPRVFDPTPKEIEKLSKVLGLSPSKISEIDRKNSYFSWVARKIDLALAERVMELGISGLYQITESSRYYPYGASLAHLVGYLNSEDSGSSGIEKRLEKDLAGLKSSVEQSKDGRGQLIFQNSQLATPEKSGHNVELTIDAAIQDIVFNSLKKGVNDAGAKGGFAVVVEPYTGAILGISTWPTFDPNRKQEVASAPRNAALADLFEPGSIMKPFIVAQALEAHKTTPDEKHYCEKNGVLKIGANASIRDDHPKAIMTTKEVIIHSSNICTYKIAQRLGMKAVFDLYKELGFAPSVPILDLPESQRGRMAHWQSWLPIRFANVSFGQGISVTALEILKSYSVFANGGKVVEPFVIRRIYNSEGKDLYLHSDSVNHRVFSTETVKAIREMLAGVVNEGTATRAKSDYYTFAGKTGTSEKYDVIAKNYSATKRIANFVGFSPVHDPKLLAFVVIDEPSIKPYYGGRWAAPVLKEIIEKSLKYMSVPPDKPPVVIGSVDEKSKKG